MGFREYNPGLNRFLTRDMFKGALTDLALGTDPWNANRYMSAGGNPISRIELDGHYAIDDNGERVPETTRRPVTVATPPRTVDPGLQALVDGEYVRPGTKNVLDDGRTTTALRTELLTGAKTGSGKNATYHLEKVLELANGYAKALRKSDTDRFHGGRGMAEADEILLRRLFKESWAVLTMKDQTNAVTADLDSRSVRGDMVVDADRRAR